MAGLGSRLEIVISPRGGGTARGRVGGVGFGLRVAGAPCRVGLVLLGVDWAIRTLGFAWAWRVGSGTEGVTDGAVKVGATVGWVGRAVAVGAAVGMAVAEVALGGTVVIVVGKGGRAAVEVGAAVGAGGTGICTVATVVTGVVACTLKINPFPDCSAKVPVGGVSLSPVTITRRLWPSMGIT